VIVHVTDFFHPRPGGIEIQVGALTAAQAAAGRTVEVVTASPSASGQRGSYGYPVHRIATPTLQGLAVTPHVAASLWQLLDRIAPKIIHIHVSVFAPLAWAAAAWSLHRRVPAVITVHSMWKKPERALYWAADVTTAWSRRLLVTAVSSQVADLVHRAGSGIKPVVVPNGIALEEWCTTRPVLAGSGYSDLHVVAAGRLHRRRRPLELLQVLHQAKQRLSQGIRLRVTVAGTGPELTLMRRFLARHGMADWVHLAGWLNRTEVRHLMADADVFVNASPVESFGIATLEARTAGVPVIARRGTGVADFIQHGREGLLAGSVAELTQALVLLASDVGLRVRLADYNRHNAPEAYAWHRILPAWEQCYAQAAEKSIVAQSREPRLRPLWTAVVDPSTMCGGSGSSSSPPAGESFDCSQVVDPGAIEASIQSEAAGGDGLKRKTACRHDESANSAPGQVSTDPDVVHPPHLLRPGVEIVHGPIKCSRRDEVAPRAHEQIDVSGRSQRCTEDMRKLAQC
jgi:phosphatidylinositol alpha 1,6-mannosyltransferase